jgi:hypothetical protein
MASTLTKTGYPSQFPTQRADILFGEEPVFRLLDDLANEGVFAAGDLAVTAPGGSIQVQVAAGDAYVSLESSSYGGKRRVHNDASSLSGAPGSPNSPDWASTFTAPHASLPRVDRVVLTVRDGLYDATSAFTPIFQVVPGTATSGATLANLNGAAAVPANSLLLANVLVGAAATQIQASDIDTLGDGQKRVRPRAFERDVLCQLTRAAAQSLGTSGTAAAIVWDQEDVDLDAMWAPSGTQGGVTFTGTQIVARTPGYYRVCGSVRFAANATGTRQVELKDEGGSSRGKVAVQATGTDETAVPFAFGPLLLGTTATTRYVTLEAMQRSGGALNIAGATIWLELEKAA